MKRRDTSARPLWAELILAVAPTVVSEVCGEIRARMQHRRAVRDGKPEKATERPS